MHDSAFSEVKMEMLKIQEFWPWRNFITLSNDWQEDESLTDDEASTPYKVYHFGYPLF